MNDELKIIKRRLDDLLLFRSFSKSSDIRILDDEIVYSIEVYDINREFTLYLEQHKLEIYSIELILDYMYMSIIIKDKDVLLKEMK